MSRAVVAIPLFLLLGCGNNQTSVGGSAREKCRDFGFSDSGVDSVFIVVNANRDAGFSRAASIHNSIADCETACPSAACAAECTNCVLAVIDEVYR